MDGSQPETLNPPIKDGRITGVEMDGKAVYRHMVRYVTSSAQCALAKAGLKLDHAVGKRMVVEGDVVLLLGSGGGLSWASTAAVWG